MGTTMTIEQRRRREAEVLAMIDDGLTVQQMASRLGVTPQAVRKFLNLRGWSVSPARSTAA